MKHTFTALFVLLMSFSVAQGADETIKLGIGGPYTGEIASMGDDIKAGVQLAVDKINAQGGLLGKKLQPLFEDDACDPKTGVIVANKFQSEKVSMATAFCSKVCMAAAPVYEEENIPFLNECIPLTPEELVIGAV